MEWLNDEWTTSQFKTKPVISLASFTLFYCTVKLPPTNHPIILPKLKNNHLLICLVQCNDIFQDKTLIVTNEELNEHVVKDVPSEMFFRVVYRRLCSGVRLPLCCDRLVAVVHWATQWDGSVWSSCWLPLYCNHLTTLSPPMASTHQYNSLNSISEALAVDAPPLFAPHEVFFSSLGGRR